MKLSKEDIQNFATEDEKDFLKEVRNPNVDYSEKKGVVTADITGTSDDRKMRILTNKWQRFETSMRILKKHLDTTKDEIKSSIKDLIDATDQLLTVKIEAEKFIVTMDKQVEKTKEDKEKFYDYLAKALNMSIEAVRALEESLTERVKTGEIKEPALRYAPKMESVFSKIKSTFYDLFVKKYISPIKDILKMISSANEDYNWAGSGLNASEDFHEDIEKYATEEEKLILNEGKRAVGTDIILSWEGGEDFDWDDITDELTYILKNKNKSGDWYAKVKGFGWRGLDGESRIEGITDGSKFLGKILPDTDCHFNIYDYGKNGLAINNFHHDSPTGKEWYYIVPYRYKKDLVESKQLNEKWKDKLQNVYSDFEEFLSYDEIYNLSERLGFGSPEEAWEANPLVSGSVNPEEYHALQDNVGHLITDEDKEGIQEATDYTNRTLKESVAEQRVANIIKYTDGDLDKWEAMMKAMSDRELHEAEFELKSAISGINHNTKTYHIPHMRNEYWDEQKERRQLYRKYLNRMKKYLENPRTSLRDKEKEDLYFNHVSHESEE